MHFSCMILEAGLQRSSVWGLALGSCGFFVSQLDAQRLCELGPCSNAPSIGQATPQPDGSRISFWSVDGARHVCKNCVLFLWPLLILVCKRACAHTLWLWSVPSGCGVYRPVAISPFLSPGGSRSPKSMPLSAEMLKWHSVLNFI